MHTKVALVLLAAAVGMVGSSLYLWQHQGSGGATALMEAAASPTALVISNPAAVTVSTASTHPSSGWVVTGTSLTDQSGWLHPGF